MLTPHAWQTERRDRLGARLLMPPTTKDWRTWLLAAAALVLLNASLTFGNVWPTPKIRWESAVSVELAACLLLLTVVRGRPDRLLRRMLPVLWLLLVLGRYLAVTAPNLYGRDFDLYWDSPHLANVAAMFARAAPTWLLVVTVAAIALALLAAFAFARATLGIVLDAVARPRLRRVLSALAAATLLGFAGQQWLGRGYSTITFADPITPAYVRQVRAVLARVAPGGVAPVLGPSPAALGSRPDGLGGADVLLVFVESYGAVTFEKPGFETTLAPSRAAFEAAARETGRQVVSAFVESPTFGGSSWLAHLSLISGMPIRDQYSYQSLMTEPRDTLVTTFARAGYRSVALMPGMWQAWPEGAFYGYDRIYGGADLDYTGPEFGWWSIPDQFTLARLDALEGDRGSRAPLFVVFPTSTTHAPFGPVAPYLPDWPKVLTSDAYDSAEVERILDRTPDWMNLSADYGHAMSYEFTVFGGYLRRRAADDLVMILIGDHQPLAAVSGEGASWTVPVHVVTSRPRIAERLLSNGFRPGLTPRRPSLGAMHELVPLLLGALEK